MQPRRNAQAMQTEGHGRKKRPNGKCIQFQNNDIEVMSVTSNQGSLGDCVTSQ